MALLIVNPRSGKEPPLEELTAEARRLGIDVHLLGPGDDPGEVARQADTGALGVAGGDGSLASVATVCVERELPLVCIPLGTRNHFARDLGLDPSDPVAALAAFANGVEQRVDVGRVNDRLFLNNVSLGSYARLVHRREHHRRRRESLARLRAFASFLENPRPIVTRIDGEPVRSRAVVVANNAYRLDLPSLGERERLDEGLLHIYVTARFFRQGWSHRAAEQVVVEARTSRARAAVDGEPAALDTPMRFRIEPGALRVLLPGVPLPRRPDTQ
jgi:diacylglycerol kinase family enzyme